MSQRQSIEVGQVTERDRALANRTVPSTRSVSLLPEPPALARLAQSLAILDEILAPDDESMRYFAYDPAWGAGGALASMSTGEGDHYEIWFSPKGTVIAGFDPEAPYAKKPAAQRAEEVYRDLPAELAQARVEFDDVTFAFFRSKRASAWTAHPPPMRGRDPDGSARLLCILDADPATYVAHARTYFDRRIAKADVAEIYAHRIDAAIIGRLNEDASVRSVLTHAKKLGFAVGRATAKTPAVSQPSAEVRKAFRALLDPVDLEKRMATFALIDAIVSPRTRTVSLTRDGATSVAELHHGDVSLFAWFSGQSGVFYTQGAAATAAEIPAALLKKWKGSAPHADRSHVVAWSTGDHWTVSALLPKVFVAFDIFKPHYLSWAKKQYGRALPVAAVNALWQLQPLTPAHVAALNPRADWTSVARHATALRWKTRTK